MFPNSVLDTGLWKRFYDDEEVTADIPPPVQAFHKMASSEASDSDTVTISVAQQEEAVSGLPTTVTGCR